MDYYVQTSINSLKQNQFVDEYYTYQPIQTPQAPLVAKVFHKVVQAMINVMCDNNYTPEITLTEYGILEEIRREW